MRIAPSLAASLAAGLLLAGAGLGPVPASAAVSPPHGIAGGTVEQARFHARRHYRSGGRKVMGLPVPGSRRGHRRGGLRRL